MSQLQIYWKEKNNTLKSIEKRCIVGDYTVSITLTDTRDNYIVPTAMGKIGNIDVSNEGTFIYPHIEDDEKNRNRKEGILLEAFKEIFGEDEYNPLSPEYYRTIKSMIENGTLSNLGYLIEEDPDFDLYEYVDFDELDSSTHKAPRR